jgi:hypothetical protein
MNAVLDANAVTATTPCDLPLTWRNSFATLGDEQPERSAYAGFPPDWAQHLEVSCSS